MWGNALQRCLPGAFKLVLFTIGFLVGLGFLQSQGLTGGVLWLGALGIGFLAMLSLGILANLMDVALRAVVGLALLALIFFAVQKMAAGG
ncbi:hypothetical protein [Thiohalorhabdus sp.]|uniref:hypothetical protein n=1 Tax=Thiohalorhabdus sp. TaxID=3094134 RepID=UPI002FC288B8